MRSRPDPALELGRLTLRGVRGEALAAYEISPGQDAHSGIQAVVRTSQEVAVHPERPVVSKRAEDRLAAVLGRRFTSLVSGSRSPPGKKGRRRVDLDGGNAFEPGRPDEWNWSAQAGSNVVE